MRPLLRLDAFVVVGDDLEYRLVVQRNTVIGKEPAIAVEIVAFVIEIFGIFPNSIFKWPDVVLVFYLTVEKF